MKTQSTHPSVSEFAENIEEYLADMRRDERPMILTHDGQPELIVFDLRLYEFLSKTSQREFIELLRRQITAIDRGEEKCVPAKEVFRNLRQKLHLPEESKV
jgi:hypothetical protein